MKADPIARQALNAVPYLCLLGLAMAGCGVDEGNLPPDGRAKRRSQAPAAPESGTQRIRLVDVTSQSGVGFVHFDGSSGKRYIVETISCGLALFDYDGDGLVDIYFCNGAPLPGATPRSQPRHALYRNLGNLKFRDATDEAGVVCNAFGLGVAVGDYNNDGAPDLALNNFGANVLYRNNGDGTFAEDAALTSVVDDDRVGAGACFLDADGDDDLDLFLANYVKFSFGAHDSSKRLGREVYPGPLDYPRENNVLLRNEGDGEWTDVSEASGISAKGGTGMGTICSDLDGDGDTDIYVANDEMANYVYKNDGNGMFQESGVSMGLAYDGAGIPTGSMGIDCGDVDNDGNLDLFVTAFQHELATLYHNSGRGMFQDITRVTGAGAGTLTNVTWGCSIADLDNDGDRDLFAACGHLDDRDNNEVYRAPNLVLMNMLSETGETKFVDVSAHCGDIPNSRFSSRGAAVDDLDNDGDLDIVVLNSRQRATILENRSARGDKAHWLQLQLRGTASNRDAVGARISVVTSAGRLVDEVHSGRGYQSHWGSRLHFGLGAESDIERVQVRWPDGETTVIRNVEPDQVLTIKQPS